MGKTYAYIRVSSKDQNEDRFDRRPKERSPEFYDLKAKWLSGEISARKAAMQLGIHRSTFKNRALK